ncbi:MAG: DUF1730 domain-containing protein [Pseudoflavonifractor sp.]
MISAEYDRAFAAAGAAAWGGVKYETLAAQMDEYCRRKAQENCPNAAAVLVAAFPYFAGETAGNLSVYARGEDYHRVLVSHLNTICAILHEDYPEYRFLATTDVSPLPEREAAWLCGMGLRGRNGMLILPPYGSYVFIGTILTDCPLDLPDAPPAADCMNCGKCVAACPTGALGDRGEFQVRSCLSDLTQRKGDLTPHEQDLLKAHPYLWGCDICQNICPYNQQAKVAPLPEFQEGYLQSLTPDLLAGLSNKTFAQQFGDRAFAWRGPAVLRRNLEVKEK